VSHSFLSQVCSWFTPGVTLWWCGVNFQRITPGLNQGYAKTQFLLNPGVSLYRELPLVYPSFQRLGIIVSLVMQWTAAWDGHAGASQHGVCAPSARTRSLSYLSHYLMKCCLRLMSFITLPCSMSMPVKVVCECNFWKKSFYYQNEYWRIFAFTRTSSFRF